MPDVERRWLKPKSDSLEDFSRFVFWTGIRMAALYYAWRYAVGADLTDPPWHVLGL